jgi:hypothetical protein
MAGVMLMPPAAKAPERQLALMDFDMLLHIAEAPHTLQECCR